MHQYRHDKLPVSFTGIFQDIVNTGQVQIRHNDYNYVNKPAVKTILENFPLKQILTNWNCLSIDLKATGEEEDFKLLLKEILLSKYNFETDCPKNCYNCN